MITCKSPKRIPHFVYRNGVRINGENVYEKYHKMFIISNITLMVKQGNYLTCPFESFHLRFSRTSNPINRRQKMFLILELFSIFHVKSKVLFGLYGYSCTYIQMRQETCSKPQEDPSSWSPTSQVKVSTPF